jgi:tRNA(Ile)-lysidine synthase
MIESGETALVGVSGGADSLALLYALHALQDELKCRLHVAHLDHGLRPDSADDAKFVAAHAERLRAPISVERVDVSRLMRREKLSVEAAARRARYHFYASEAERIGATKIALGHHRGDQAETVLMNLLRGAGAAGLKGMRPVRDGKFIRPLLDFSRREIELFVSQLGLTPREDATNRRLDYLRNRIRHELIPHLESAYNPKLQDALSRAAELLCAESDFLDGLAVEALSACRLVSDAPDTVVLDCNRLQRRHLALRRRVLRLVITELLGDAREVDFHHIESALRLMAGDAPNAALYLPDGWTIRRAYDRIYFQRATDAHIEFEYEIEAPGRVSLPALNAELVAWINSERLTQFPDGKFEAVFDLDEIQFPLIVRNRRDGDRFQPFGMQGRKRVKDLLIDAKAPLPERERTPLLVSEREIIWVIGRRTSERCKVSPETRRYLHLKYLPGVGAEGNHGDIH